MHDLTWNYNFCNSISFSILLIQLKYLDFEMLFDDNKYINTLFENQIKKDNI